MNIYSESFVNLNQGKLSGLFFPQISESHRLFIYHGRSALWIRLVKYNRWISHSHILFSDFCQQPPNETLPELLRRDENEDESAAERQFISHKLVNTQQRFIHLNIQTTNLSATVSNWFTDNLYLLRQLLLLRLNLWVLFCCLSSVVDTVLRRTRKLE